MSELERAVRFVRAVLADGPRPAGEVSGLAATEGIKASTLRRARKRLGIKPAKKGSPGPDGWWELALPEDGHEGMGASDGAKGALEIFAALVLPTGKTLGESASPVQRADAEAILASDPPARRYWCGQPRGSGKTFLAGALTISAVLGGIVAPGDRGFFCGADKDVARLAADELAGLARRSDLGGLVVVESGRVRFPRHDVEIEIMSSDAPSAWGRTGSWYVIDELPNWADTPNSRSFWEAISTSFPKVPTSRVIIIGTASSPSHFAARIHEDALTDTRWRVSDVHTPAPWIDPAEIEGERRRLSAGSFARLWENRWVQAEDHLVLEENLRRCVTVTEWPATPKSGTRHIIGVDLATKYDSTAICAAHAETRGGERHVVLDDMEVHAPRPGADVSLPNVEKRVEQLAQRYHPSEVHFDPSNASQMIENLRGRGVRCEEFKFTPSANDRMTNTLHTMLRDGLIDLPDDERLLDELLSVRVVETRLGGLKVDTMPGKHDDQVDALGICTVVLMERRTATGAGILNSKLAPIFKTAPVTDRTGPSRPGWLQ